MKQLIISLFILVTVFLFGACKKNPADRIQSTKVVLIEDLTDTFVLAPRSDPVLALFDFKQHPEQEAAFDYVYVTDMQLNPVAGLHLSNGITAEAENNRDDVHFRDKQIAAFYAKVRQTCTSSRERFAARRGRNQSEVFCSIISQLRQLAASHYRRKRLIIFSDLNEHSEIFSAYSAKNRKQLEEDPEAVGAILSERCAIPRSLEGITITFVYQPCTKEQDMLFMDWLGVYQRLLEKRGAKIFFQASADNFLRDYD